MRSKYHILITEISYLYKMIFLKLKALFIMQLWREVLIPNSRVLHNSRYDYVVDNTLSLKISATPGPARLFQRGRVSKQIICI